MKNNRKAHVLILALLLSPLFIKAAAAAPIDEDEEVKVSTTPIGSPFYRHLAFDMNVDLRRLYRFERRGFGHAEIINLVLLHKITGTPLKDYGNRRMKEHATLKQLTEEAGLDYVTTYKIVQQLKEFTESKGVNNLPPPIFDYRLDEEKEKQKGKDTSKEKGKEEQEKPK